MRLFCKKGMLAILLLALVSSAQEARQSYEREYAFPIATVEAALRQLGAYAGARLPALEGFIRTTRSELPQYQRAYYEYKIELAPATRDRTLVRLKVSISAWYEDPQGKQSGYQAFESNGRLETDLLDRLNDLLNSKGGIEADPERLARKVQEIRQQRAQAEIRISELQHEIANFENTSAEKNTDYVSILKSVTSIRDRPTKASPVLLQARSEDAFQILESRGAWLRVALEDSHSGWVRRTQVQINSLASSNQVPARPSSAAGFTVIREMSSTFSGDWPRLKNHPALYIWAKPQGLAPNLAIAEKWHFAAATFKERYREFAHMSNDAPDGIVVIFLDDRGGVAAAVLDDIRQWAEESLSSSAFLKRCSLDPAGAFEVSTTSQASVRKPHPHGKN